MDIVQEKCGFEVRLTLLYFGICVGCIPNQKDHHEMKKKVKMWNWRNYGALTAEKTRPAESGYEN